MQNFPKQKFPFETELWLQFCSWLQGTRFVFSFSGCWLFLRAVKKRYCCIIQLGLARLLVFWDIFITLARARHGLASPLVSIIKPELGCNRKVLLHYRPLWNLYKYHTSHLRWIYTSSMISVCLLTWQIDQYTFSYCNNHENVWIFCITNKTYIRHTIQHNKMQQKKAITYIHLQIAEHQQWLWGGWTESRQGPPDGSIPMIRSVASLDLWKVWFQIPDSHCWIIMVLYLYYFLIKDFWTQTSNVPFLQNRKFNRSRILFLLVLFLYLPFSFITRALGNISS